MRKHLAIVLLSAALAACGPGGVDSTLPSDPGTGNPGGNDNDGSGDDDPGTGGIDDDDDDDDDGDDPGTPDDPGDPDPPDPSTCLGIADIDALLEQEAFVTAQDEAASQQVRFLWADVSTGAKVDILEVSLWDGFGEFAGGVAEPGTYPLGAEDDCGVCVALLADVDIATDAEPLQIYEAVSGTVTITSVDGNLTGSLSNVVLQRVDATTGEVDGDCESTLDSGDFDAPLEVDDGT